MPDSQDFDDEWDDRPAPVTAVAIRLEEAAVDAVRGLAAPQGVSAADLLRRWVMERLAAELAPPPEPERAPATATKTAATKTTATKQAAATKAAATKKPPAAKKKAPAKKAAARKKA